jgi:hypothetical protein
MTRFLQAMAVLIEAPLLAALPALLLLGVHLWSRRRLALVAALAWLAYVPYELGMKYRILCSGECNIRVDLLILYPGLALLSLAAVVAAAWPDPRGPGRSRSG